MGGNERSAQLARALAGLRARILRGDYEAGRRLRETALSDELGISRTPIRQAMDRLVEEGLIERGETGGCRVATLSLADIMDAIELRGVMEGTAARLAAERGAVPELYETAAETLAALDRVVADPRAIDFPAYVERNAEFHDLVARMAGSAIVAREVARATRLPVASPSAFLQGQELFPDFGASLVHAQAQHRAIHEAIGAREGARAEALAREHARLARQNLTYVTTERPHLADRVPGLALVANE